MGDSQVLVVGDSGGCASLFRLWGNMLRKGQCGAGGQASHATLSRSHLYASVVQTRRVRECEREVRGRGWRGVRGLDLQDVAAGLW